MTRKMGVRDCIKGGIEVIKYGSLKLIMTSEDIRDKYLSIKDQIDLLENEVANLDSELKSLRDRCTHPSLPKRTLGEQYMDTCPDCGHLQYCYVI